MRNFLSELCIAGLIGLAVLIFVGVGYMSISEIQYKAQIKIECIRAGKTLIEGSCLKVAQ